MFEKYLVGLYSLFRLLFLKYILRKNIRFHPVQSLSPWASFILNKGAFLVLDRNTQFSRGCDVHVGHGAFIDVGEQTYFNKGCILSCHSKVTVGSGCLFGPDVKIYDNDHVFEVGRGVVAGKHKSSPISIGNNCWIAANVIVLRGATIGDNCIIGTGCIIKGDIPSNAIVTVNQQLSINVVHPVS